jgi:hypothetical protein
MVGACDLKKKEGGASLCEARNLHSLNEVRNVDYNFTSTN